MQPYRRKTQKHNTSGTYPQTFHITITCNPKNKNQLCHPETAQAVLETTNYRNTNKTWLRTKLLLMPDHLHTIIETIPIKLTEQVGDFKHWLSRTLKINSTTNFHDHRILNTKALEEITEYINKNPVKANLCNSPVDWKYNYTTTAPSNILKPTKSK